MRATPTFRRRCAAFASSSATNRGLAPTAKLPGRCAATLNPEPLGGPALASSLVPPYHGPRTTDNGQQK
jgi:hypothetical protein